MRLAWVELAGFKSFASRTRVLFGPGLNCIVGANGAGKSNLVDAVVWALGVQGLRPLRSEEPSDLIFAGSENRPPAGRAEVQLAFGEVEAGPEVLADGILRVGRRVYRSGEGVYLLGSREVRLLDVQEALAELGLGRALRAVVQQGQLEQVLRLRPEERRTLVEEAAGLLALKARKERAERRLAAVEEGLARLRQNLHELRRASASLSRQAEAAVRREEVLARLREARARLLLSLASAKARQEADHLSRLDELSARALKARAREERLAEAVREAEEKVRRGEADGREASRVLWDLEEAARRARHLSRRLAELRRLSPPSPPTPRGREDLEASEEELRRARGELAQVEAETLKVEEELALVREDLERLRKERRAQEREVARAREALWAASSAREVAKHRLELALERAEAAAERMERAERALREAHSLLARVGSEVAGTEELLEAASARLRNAEEAEGRLIRQEAEAARELARASEEAARARSRAEALISAAPSLPLGPTSSGGVLPLPLAIEVEPGFERAVSAWLGELTRALVARTPEEAVAALEELAARGCGGLVIHGTAAAGRPREALPGAGVQAGGESPPGLPLSEVVRVRAEADGVLEGLFRGVVVVEGLEEAREVARRVPEALVVSRDGWFFGQGVVRLQDPDEDLTAFFRFQSQVEEAEKAVEAKEKERAAAEVHWLEVRRRLEQARQEVARVRGEVSSLKASCEAALTREKEARQRLGVLEEEVRRARAEWRAADEGVKLARDVLEKAAREEALAAEALRKAEERASLVPSEKEGVLLARERELDRRLRELGSLRSRLSAEVASAQARVERAREERRRAEEARRAWEAGVAHLEQERARAARLEQRALVLLGELEEIAAEAARFLEEARARAEVGLVSRGVWEGELLKVREEAARASAEEAVLQTTAAELQRELEQLGLRLRRDYGLALPAASTTLGDPTELEEEVRRLEQELELIGPVDPLAPREYQALQERISSLKAEWDDLSRARRSLVQAAEEIHERLEEEFRRALEGIGEAFKRTLSLFLPGAVGSLEVAGEGVVMKVALKGGRRPSSLSGGEKSLLALAFVLALQEERPAPFLLLDEVDAALDEPNLQLFVESLLRLAQQRQVLVVTHQRATMEAAHHLHGVVKGPDGSSRVYSLDVEEALRMASSS